MPSGNLVSWGRAIAVHAKAERSREALQSFWQMGKAGVEPDKFTCVSLLKACVSTSDLTMGKFIHTYTVDMGFDAELLVGNCLINMYGKCGSIRDAHHMLSTMPTHDVVSWTTVMVAYAQHNYGNQLLVLLQDMCQARVKPNRITVITVLNTLHSASALGDGMCIHALVVEEGLDSQLVVGNCIISMYSKCGSLSDAQGMLETMTLRNTVSWNSMIAAYAQQGHVREAFHHLQKLQEDGVQADKISFVSILKGCNGSLNLREGKMIHAYMVEIGIELDVVMGTSLIDMYGKCGSVEDARVMFDSLVLPNVISWTSMITAYATHDLFEEALQMFQKMLQVGMKPDKIVFVEILEACASSSKHIISKMIHGHIVDMGSEADVVVGTALINMYGKCGSIEDAKSVFAKMTKRNVISWTAMIQVCAQHGRGKDALQHFGQMQEDGLKPNTITCLNVLDACAGPVALEEGRWVHAFILENEMESDTALGNALINMYNKCGCLEDASLLFARMNQRDVVSWTSILSAYTEHGQGKQAFQFFEQMLQGGGKLDKVSFISILDVCGKFAALELGQVMHAYIIDNVIEFDVEIGIALANMYNKCGSLEDSRSVFDKLPGRSLILWSSLIAAYSQHGLGEQVIHLFQQMREHEVKPDVITFVSVLSACSHAALVSEGMKCFDSMSKEHGLTPTLEHYMCVIDLLGRVGLLDIAESFIIKMPFQPNAVIWMAFLGACRLHNDLEHAKQAAEHVLELDSSHAAAYVVLSNIYAAAGKWNNAELLRKAHVHPWWWKCMEVNSEVPLCNINVSCPLAEEYTQLDRMNVHMKDGSHVFNINSALHDVGEQRDEFLLCCQSK